MTSRADSARPLGGGLRDRLLSLVYALRAWRCLLFGHAWGDEQEQWEDAGYPAHVETWRECERPECGAYELLWSVYWPPSHENCRCVSDLEAGVLR